MSKIKLITLICILIAIINPTYSQNVTITYLEEPNIEGQTKEIEDPLIAKSIAKELESMKRITFLIYNKGESVYTKEKILAKMNALPSLSNHDQIIVMDDNDILYKSHQEKLSISQEFIMDRPFLIEEPLDNQQWKLVNDTTIINGFQCKKAINNNNDVAWYAIDIPIGDGPLNYWGLPGMILKVETKYLTYIAQNVDLKSSASDEIKKPTTGKKITRNELNKILEEKMMEMKNDFEGNE